MHIRGFLLALLFGGTLLLLMACSSSYRIIIKGREFPPRPPNCEIQFENIDPDKAALAYEQIGLITIDDFSGELTEGVKDELRTRACQMGGEIIVPMTEDLGWEDASASFLVLTSRTGKPE